MTGKWPILLMVRELGIGGCERDLTKVALALDRSRFEPHVGCFHAEGLRAPELREGGIPILHLPVRSFASFSALAASLQMGRYARQHGIRLVHSFDVPTDVFGAPVARAFGVPIVITSQLSYRSMYSPFYRGLLRLTDKLADKVVVNSQAVEQDLLDKGLRPEDIYLSYNGVDTQAFHPTSQPQHARSNSASIVIGSVCALRSEKRLDLLLEAFSRVRNLQPCVKLAIIGSGVELTNLLKTRDRLGLAEYCHFEPATREVASWMRSMDIFVCCSSTESFPNALLEAMACGCCAIGARAGGIPELITHMRNGLLFESGDLSDLTHKLQLAIQDEGLREKLGQEAAISTRESFSIEIAVRRLEALYQGLFEQHKVPRVFSPENSGQICEPNT